jgi:hypothetical protein
MGGWTKQVDLLGVRTEWHAVMEVPEAELVGLTGMVVGQGILYQIQVRCLCSQLGLQEYLLVDYS